MSQYPEDLDNNGEPVRAYSDEPTLAAPGYRNYAEPVRAYSDEPPQAAPGYSDYAEPSPAPPEPPRQSWYRTGPALVAAGALGALVLAALIFAIVKLATGSSSPSTTTTPSPSSRPASSSAATPTSPNPGGAGGTTVITQSPQTITETVAPTATNTGSPAPSSATDTGSPAPSSGTDTVTQTVIAPPPPRPFRPRLGP